MIALSRLPVSMLDSIVQQTQLKLDNWIRYSISTRPGELPSSVCLACYAINCVRLLHA